MAWTWVFSLEREHHGGFGRVHFQADDVDELGLEVGLGERLDHVGAPRALAPRTPYARYNGHPVARGQRGGPGSTASTACRWVSSSSGPQCAAMCGHDRLQALSPGVKPVLAAPPRSHGPLHPVGPRLEEPISSLSPSLVPCAESPCTWLTDRTVTRSVGQSQQRSGPHHPPVRLRTRPRHALQRLASHRSTTPTQRPSLHNNGAN